MKKPMKTTMQNIGGGIAPALFQAGMERVLENIADERTSSGKSRTVTMTFTFKPDETRTQTICEVNMKTTLAQIASKKAVTYLSKDEDGSPRMTASDPKQSELAEGLMSIETLREEKEA